MIEQKPNKIKGQHIRRQRDGKSYLIEEILNIELNTEL